eukprot:6195933-Pleurochrysis_carterae.AAC.1
MQACMRTGAHDPLSRVRPELAHASVRGVRVLVLVAFDADADVRDGLLGAPTHPFLGDACLTSSHADHLMYLKISHEEPMDLRLSEGVRINLMQNFLAFGSRHVGLRGSLHCKKSLLQLRSS